MDRIFLIIKQDYWTDLSFQSRKELVGMYADEKSALADVDRLIEETFWWLTEEEAKDYQVNKDIEKLNDEPFDWHEGDGYFTVAEVTSKEHEFAFSLYCLDFPFKGRFNLDELELASGDKPFGMI